MVGIESESTSFHKITTPSVVISWLLCNDREKPRTLTCSSEFKNTASCSACSELMQKSRFVTKSKHQATRLAYKVRGTRNTETFSD
jgi:hypothetical protein